MLNSVEKNALKFVKKKEKENDRIAKRVVGIGFDLLSKGKHETRYIEVKSRKSKQMGNEELTERESQVLLEKENYWLYYVFNVEKGQYNPSKYKLCMIPRKIILKRIFPITKFLVALGKKVKEKSFEKTIWEEVKCFQ